MDVQNIKKSIKNTGVIFVLTTAILFLIGIATIITRTVDVNFVTLFNNLSFDDSQKIIAELEKDQIKYKTLLGGATLMVSSANVAEIRLKLASMSLPQNTSSVGYEIFDKDTSFGTPRFIYDINLVRALEGELSRTIAGFDSVKNARVHLVLPKNNTFSKKPQPSSASIVLELGKYDALSKSEISAITHLIATAVPNLDVNNITIVDVNGKTLHIGGKNSNEILALSHSEDYRISFEKRIKDKIESIIGELIGYDKVRAEVNADINFDKTVVNSEIFDPQSQVARSIQINEETSNNVSNSNTRVTAENNFTNAVGAASSEPTNQTDTSSVNEIRNFEISKTIKNFVSNSGTLEKLSIAVLVDGSYKKTVQEATEQAAESVFFEYIPRTNQELKNITNIIKNTVGYNEDRGDKIEVINMEFAKPPLVEEPSGLEKIIRDDLRNIIQTIILGVIIIMIILFIVKPAVNKAFEIRYMKYEEEKDERNEYLSHLEKMITHEEVIEETQDSFSQILNEQQNYAIKQTNEILKNYPEESLGIFREWMSQDYR